MHLVQADRCHGDLGANRERTPLAMTATRHAEGARVALEHSDTYVLTDDGQRFAVFYTRPTTGSCGHCWPPTNHPLRMNADRPLRLLDHAVTNCVDEARIAA